MVNEMFNEDLNQIFEELNSPHAATRRKAAILIGRMANSNDLINGPLLQAADDADWSVRGNAAIALGRAAQVTEEILAFLTNKLGDPSDKACSMYYRALIILIDRMTDAEKYNFSHCVIKCIQNNKNDNLNHHFRLIRKLGTHASSAAQPIIDHIFKSSLNRDQLYWAISALNAIGKNSCSQLKVIFQNLCFIDEYLEIKLIIGINKCNYQIFEEIETNLICLIDRKKPSLTFWVASTLYKFCPIDKKILYINYIKSVIDCLNPEEKLMANSLIGGWQRGRSEY